MRVRLEMTVGLITQAAEVEAADPAWERMPETMDELFRAARTALDIPEEGEQVVRPRAAM